MDFAKRPDLNKEYIKENLDSKGYVYDIESMQRGINKTSHKERNAIPPNVRLEITFKAPYFRKEDYDYRGNQKDKRHIWEIKAIIKKPTTPVALIVDKEFPLGICPTGMQYLVNYLMTNGGNCDFYNRTFTCYRHHKDKHDWEEIRK